MVTCGGVDDQPGSLVDRHQPLVFEDHILRHPRGPQQLVGRFDQPHLDLLSGVDPLRDPSEMSIDAYGTGPQHAMNAKPGVVSELSCDDSIDASSTEVVGDGEADFWCGETCGGGCGGGCGRFLVRHRDSQWAQ